MDKAVCLFGVLIFISCFLTDARGEESPREFAPRKITLAEEQKLSDQILTILDHYKQDDPVGIPGAPIPDPLDVPDMKHAVSAADMTFYKVKLYGLSQFRIREMRANIAEMKVEAAIDIDALYVYGNYTMKTLFSSARGPFNVNLTGVYSTALATLEVRRNGKLEAQDMAMDVQFKEITMDFKGLGFFASMFQGVISSIGNFIFESIKPIVLEQVNGNMRTEVNKQVELLNQTFPNSISPFDQVVSEVRHKIRNSGYDPYKVPDYNNSVGIVDVYMTHTWLTGLSSIHRYKDILFEVRNKTVYVTLDIGTQKLKGKSNWEIALISGIMSRAGTVAFTVNHVRVHANVSQTMDTRNHPVLEDIQLELGNIQIRFDGTGTFDYVIEAAINILPNIIRFQIMDALETPIKSRIQEALDTVNIERLVKQNAKDLDEGKNPFQMLT